MITSRNFETSAESTEDPQSELTREAVRFARALRAERKSPRTVEGYLDAITQLDRFLAEQGMPRTLMGISREHVTEFMIYLQENRAPATALNRFRSLHVFFGWLHDEGEMEKNPMERMKPPTVEPEPPAVLSEDQIKRLFKACEGKEFRERRDMAICRLLLDTGLRREELARLKLHDVDDADQLLTVRIKGDRVRLAHYNHKAARDLDRYLRARERHPDAKLPWLWLTLNGRGDHLTGSGIYQIMEYRARIAGIGHVTPHQWRHSFAHYSLQAGMQEGDVMRAGGWRRREMLDRYGKSLAEERARKAHEQFSPGDRF